MGPSTSRKSVILIPLSIGALAAVTYVQSVLVGERTEVAVRASAGVLGLLAVPLLVALACRTWVKLARPTLSNWRNGLGLASIIILCISWLLFAVVLVIERIRPEATRFFSPDWFATILWSTQAAALLALALRGPARNMGISAAFLMCA
jgi:hypothetical protein